MPIRINLLAEAQAAEQQRRNDPVKRAIYLGAFILVLALAWSSTLQLETMRAKRDFSMVETEIQSHTNDYSRVMVSLKKIADTQQKLDQLKTLNHARFLQGNLLNALQKLTMPNIQITRLRVAQSYQPADAKGTKTTEKINISLDVRDSSANPGDQVNKFKELVAGQPYFQSVLAQTDGIRLSNLSAPQTGYDGKPYVLFTLECQLADQTR